ncbi:hypothetical protein BDN72DRAFT_203656 [Pluteus cervinus]|uniref:Uncharacterized protein n=1 Tax=Pluteus cervinus TaxID=181527 RepID=A0ACD3AHX9_9AGAR|nr:hypothetical protein BDN72DRAFT_203656 [Pluteus cervinus]
MKALSALVSCALVATSQAHSIFQKVSVDGVEHGLLFGVRTPDGSYQNYPITSLEDPDFACNTGIVHKDNNVIDIPAGSKVGAWWGHVLGGPQWEVDTDNPIAPSHKGPVTVYLAKVDDAAAAEPTGLDWFKVGQEGLNTTTGKWGVDTVIENEGWWYFTMPACLAPGNYLMRVELLALHSAYAAGGAQFYMECAQINVVGDGTNVGENFVPFPGAYEDVNDPSILINIYDNTGTPNNALKPYVVLGPEPLTC